MADVRQKTVVVGAGPVGSLAALYAAQRGHDVEVYELRNDLRDPSTVPLNFTKSINLALSERGINALGSSGNDTLLGQVFDQTVPMRGRMIHGRTPAGSLYEDAQDYDVHGRTIYAIDRADLNRRMLDILEQMPNVKLFFNHKLTGANFRTCKAWVEVQNAGADGHDGRAREMEISYDFLIGADGAHSAVRHHLMKYARMDFQQEYIDTLWCELRMEPRADADPADPLSRFAISPNHLHIWPGRTFMFIAIPSEDGSFTCTLFAPSAEITYLEADPAERLPEFFDRFFPGVTDLIPPAECVRQFTQNPHLPLLSINCKPHHFQSSVVIVGDAAHAMVPFYGQGMNAGLEDVRVLFSILDKYAAEEGTKTGDGDAKATAARARGLALEEYTTQRVPDAFAIVDLALQNYTEMRASVLSPTYRLRKYLEEQLSVYVPWLGWQTRYARVSFGNERYSDVVRKTAHQGRMLQLGLSSALGLSVLTGLAVLRWRFAGGRGLFGAVTSQFRGLFGW